jgi:hypothetical protein
MSKHYPEEGQDSDVNFSGKPGKPLKFKSISTYTILAIIAVAATIIILVLT